MKLTRGKAMKSPVVAILVCLNGLLLTFCNSESAIRPEPTPDAAAGPKAGAAGSGSAGAGGASGKAGGAPHKCPEGLPGPPLVEVTFPDGAAYCIDATEVTQAQYHDFASAKKGDMAGQPEVCVFNKSWVPEVMGPEQPAGCPKGYYEPGQNADLPMVCTNWCQAKAYCEWAGKRLCRAAGGGKVDAKSPEGATDPRSEWYNACTQRGKTRYPYGDTYDAAKCYFNGKGPDWFPAAATSPLVADCHGTEPPFDRLLNMSGNVGEWEDSCDFPELGDRLCRLRGGSVQTPVELHDRFECSSPERGYPAELTVGAGIRCCTD